MVNKINVNEKIFSADMFNDGDEDFGADDVKFVHVFASVETDEHGNSILFTGKLYTDENKIEESADSPSSMEYVGTFDHEPSEEEVDNMIKARTSLLEEN